MAVDDGPAGAGCIPQLPLAVVGIERGEWRRAEIGLQPRPVDDRPFEQPLEAASAIVADRDSDGVAVRDGYPLVPADIIKKLAAAATDDARRHHTAVVERS